VRHLVRADADQLRGVLRALDGAAVDVDEPAGIAKALIASELTMRKVYRIPRWSGDLRQLPADG
jgi:hypothetical protein